MKTTLALVAFAAFSAACGAPKDPAPAEAAQEAEPTAESPMEQNRAEKYVSGLQSSVNRAQEAQKKADAANKKMLDSQEALQQAEGQ